jgi:hypothetical protein
MGETRWQAQSVAEQFEPVGDGEWSMANVNPDGTLKIGEEAEADTLGFGGPHTHPVSAPHEYAQESGTPAFSKGHHSPEDRLSRIILSEEDVAKRGQAQPERR